MTEKRVILLGFDGMDPRITESMMEKGELPNFSRLHYSRLPTINPSQSPVVWTTIATGVPPSDHGIFDFIHRDPKNYLPYLSMLQLKGFRYLSPVKAKTFWEKASEKEIPSTIIRWPVTFPPAPFKGRILSGLGVPDIRGTLGTYTLFTTDPGRTGAGIKGNLVEAAVRGNRINCRIPGPVATTLRGRKEISVDLVIETQGDRVRCTAGDKVFEVHLNRWSERVEMRFELGLFRTVAGHCKFFLNSIEPEFDMYMTPINISCASRELPISYPQAYAEELQSSIGSYASLGMAEDTNGLNDEVISEDAFLEECNCILDERKRMLYYELVRFKEGLLACVFDTTDRVQHMFWRTIDESHPSYDDYTARKYRHVIHGYYKKMDRILGYVMDVISPGTLLMICSDHGFSSYKRSVHLNTWLMANGFLKLKDGTLSSEGLFEGVDWQRTTAYALGFSSIYLNIKGREREGIVKEDQVPHIKGELIRKLNDLRDGGSGVVQGVCDTTPDGLHIDKPDSPDLLVAYREGFRNSSQTAIGGISKDDVLEDNKKKWSGDHCCDMGFVPGIFFTNSEASSRNLTVSDIAGEISDFLRCG